MTEQTGDLPWDYGLDGLIQPVVGERPSRWCPSCQVDHHTDRPWPHEDDAA